MIGIEAALNSFSGSVVDRIMKAIWAAAMWLLRTAFELVDGLGGFRDGSALVDASGRPSPAAPFYALWPTLMWIGGAVAVGLFLWQLTLAMVRGGAGFWRVASGPVAYGVATALTLGVVAALVGAAEGLTVLLLQRGLAADNFRTILDHPSLGLSDNPNLDSSIDATARALLLGMIALFGLLPAAIGFLLQMLFRQAVIIVLVATVPITAAGLLANTTAVWFWRALRWMLAAVLMKPALALVLVVGVNMLSGPTGVGGLFAGTGVLLISLFCPLVLFRLLAFVERGPQFAGAARSGAAAGVIPSGALTGFALGQVNTARFDAAVHGAAIGPERPDAGTAGHGSGGGALAAAARSVRGHSETALDGVGIGTDAGFRATAAGFPVSGTPAPSTTAAPPRLPAARPMARGAPGDAPPLSDQATVGRRPPDPRAAGNVPRGASGPAPERPAGSGPESRAGRRDGPAASALRGGSRADADRDGGPR
jgi:hypothetical protein